MTHNELEKELNSGTLHSIYLFYGEETFILETMLKKIKNKFGELLSGINYVMLDSNNIDRIIENIETPSFGYEKKLIIAKDTGLFTKTKKAEENKITIKLTEYIENNAKYIQENVVIVFIEDEIDKNKLAKQIETSGVVCNFEKLKADELIKRLKSIVNAYKVNIEPATIKYLLEVSGTNMHSLINEVRKLIEYTGEGGEITNKTIDLLATKQVEAVIFDLTDSLGKKEIKTALQILKNLLYQKEPMQKIIITLYNHFRKLYIVKLADKYNENVADSLNLKANQLFLVSKYKQQSKYFSEEELKNVLQEFIDLDRNYKLGIIDINIGMETILCYYCTK
jgi:DNA polymerase-3 subunit delta